MTPVFDLARYRWLGSGALAKSLGGARAELSAGLRCRIGIAPDLENLAEGAGRCRRGSGNGARESWRTA